MFKPKVKIRSACENVFELLNAHDQEVTLSSLVGILTQSTVEEAEKHEPESKEKTTTVSKVNGGLGFIEFDRTLIATKGEEQQPDKGLRGCLLTAKIL